MTLQDFRLETLETIIAERSRDPASTSYTRSLLDAGTARTAKKFGEEAVELVIAAVQKDRRETVREAADVLYHLLVLLRCENIGFAEVVAELGRRTARSGLEEKASRTDSSADT
jgi:phosphoribosyl-ATP pyrophosphohydrolase